MPETAARLIKRWERLYSVQASARNQWQDIADYCVPWKSNILVQRVEGEKQTEKLFDATAPHALMLLASSLHASMTPSTQPWLSLKMRQDELNESKPVTDWLEDCAQRLHRAFRQSHFNQAVHELWIDLAAFATGAMFVEEKAPTAAGAFGGFRFLVPAVGSYVISEDADGQVDTLFRKFALPLRSAYAKWGDKLGPDLVGKLATRPDDPIEILHTSAPRHDRAYDGVTGRPKRGAGNLPWSSCYIAMQPKLKLEEGGYEEFPWMVPRWAKTSGELYGRGPSHTALPDVKSLNTTKELLLKAAPLAMIPPTYERDDSVIGTPDLTAGGRVVINAAGSIPDSFGFLQTGQRVDLSQMTLGELRQGVRLVYFTDQLILHEKPNMTATEVMALQEQMQRLLGPTTGRLEAEFLNPLVQRCFAIMARAGAFLPLPEELREVTARGQADLDVEYEGPLARAQRTIELTAQDRVLGFISLLVQAKAQFPGDEWDLLNTDKMIRDRADITGLPSDNLRADDVIAQDRQARKTRADNLLQFDVMERAAKAAGSATPFLKEIAPNPQTAGNGARR